MSIPSSFWLVEVCPSGKAHCILTIQYCLKMHLSWPIIMISQSSSFFLILRYPQILYLQVFHACCQDHQHAIWSW